MNEFPPVVFSLPIPPSANNLYRNAGGRGRVKSVEYVRWQIYAATFVPRLVRLPAARPYALAIDAPLGRRRDLGNIEKAITDLLVTIGLVPDDRWCDELCLRRTGTGERARVEVRGL